MEEGDQKLQTPLENKDSHVSEWPLLAKIQFWITVS